MLYIKILLTVKTAFSYFQMYQSSSAWIKHNIKCIKVAFQRDTLHLVSFNLNLNEMIK